MKKIYLITVMCCLSIAGFAATYINIPGTTLNVASHWTSDGTVSGTPAGNFTSAGDVFTLSSAPAATSLALPWTLGAITLNITTPVTFNGGVAVNLSGTTVTSNSTLTFSAAGNTLTVGDGVNPTSLTMTSGNLLFSVATATLTIAVGGTVDMQGAAANMSTYAAASIVNNGTFKTASTSATPFATGKDFTAGNTATGLVEFYSTSNQTIIAGTYYSLKASGVSTKTTGVITVRGALDITAGIVNLGGAATVAGNVTIGGGCTLSAGANTLSVGGNFTNNGLFTSGTGTVTFNATTSGHIISGNLKGTSKFYKLTFNGAGGAWQFGALGTTPVEVANTFTLTNGTLTAPSDTLTLSGTTSFTGGTFNNNGGTVYYNGTTAIQSIAGLSYYNLAFGGTTFAKTTGGAYTVANDMNIKTTSGAVALGASSIGGNLAITATTGIVTLGSALTVNGSISITGTTASSIFDVSASNYQISLGGNWTVSSTTAASLFNGRAGTVVFSGMGTQTIASAAGSALPNFFNFRNSNTANTVSISNNATIAGNMTNNSGAMLNTGATVMTVGGNWANNGSITNTGTVIFNAATSGHTLTGSMIGGNKFNNLTFSGLTPGSWTFGSLPVEVTGDLTISGTGTVTATSDTIKLTGNFNHSGGAAGNFDANGGTVSFAGTGAQAFPGSKATTFYNLSIANNTATVTANSNTTVSHAMTAVASSNINMSAFQLLGSFDATSLNGYLQTQNASIALPTGLVWGGTVDYNSLAAAQVVSSGTYNNLTLTGTTKAKTITGGTAVAGDLVVTTTTGVVLMGGNLDVNGNINITGTIAPNIFDAASFQINCGGNWTMNSTTAANIFKPGGGVVIFDGVAAQTVTATGGAALNFNSLRNSNTTNPVTLSTNTTMTGNLTVDAMAVLNAFSPTLTIAGDFSNAGTYNLSGAQALTVGGNWSNTGSFNAGMGSVTFNATTAGHTISGALTGANGFNTITFSGNTPATWTFGGSAADVAGDFTISGTGTVTATTATLQIGGDFNHNAGTVTNFNANGGTVRLNGTIPQAIPGTVATNFATLTFSNSTPRMITASAIMTIANAFTIPSGDTLNMGALALTCSNDFTNNGIYSVSGAQALSVAGSFANTGTFACGTGANALIVGGNFFNTGMGSFDASTGTVTFNAASTGHTISGNLTGSNNFNNLTFNNAAGGWDFGSNNAEVGGVFTITNGSVTAPSTNLTVTGNFVNSATGTFNHNNGTVVLNGVAQTMPGAATTFYDLNLSNASGMVTANAATTINHALISPAGNTLNMATFQLLGSFNATAMAGSLLTQYVLTGAPVPSGVTWGGLVNFNAGTTTQTVPSGAYNYLSLTGTTSIKKNGGVSTVAADLNITTTTGIDSIGVDSVGGNMNIIATGTGTGVTSLGSALRVLGNMSITGTSGANILDVTPANYQINVGGNWTLSSTTATTLLNARAGLVVFDGTGAQTISATSGGGNLNPNFFSFRNSNTSNAITLNSVGTAAVTGDMTIDTGAVLNVAAPTVALTGNFLNNGTYTSPGTQALSIKGNYTNNGSFSAGTGTVTFNATTAGHTLSGKMTGTNKFNNLSFTGATPATWALNNAVTVGGNFTIAGTGTVTATSDTLRVAGNFAHNTGTVANFQANGGTVRLNGTSAQSIPGAIATTFNTLNIAGTSRTITGGAAMIVKNAISIPTGVTLDMGIAPLTDSSDFINNGAYTCAGGQLLTIRGNYSNTSSFNAGTGTVAFAASDAGHTLAGSMTGGNTFYNLSFTGNTPGAWAFSDSASVGANFTISGTGAVTAPSSVLRITGNFAHNAGSFIHNSGTVNLNGVSQSLPGSLSTTFNSLTIDNHVDIVTMNKAVTIVAPFSIPSNVTLFPVGNALTDSSDFNNDGIYSPTGAQSLTVRGNFSNTGNFTSGTSAAALTFGGNFANTGTFNSSTGTASFNSVTSGNTISGSTTGANKFNNVTFTGNAPGAWTFTDSSEVAGAFTISGTGTVTAPSSILKIGGNFAHTAGTFNHNNGTVNLNGAGAQLLPGTVATTFSSLIMADNSRTVTLNKNVTVLSAFTIPVSVTFAAGPNALTDSGNFTNNGIFNTTGAQALIVVGNLTNNGNYAASTTQTLSVSGDFSNTGTFTPGIGATALTFGGNYANTGTFNAGTSTATFNGGTMGLMLSGSMTGSNAFNNITFSNTSGGWSFGSNAADVSGIFTLTNGTVTAPSSNLKITGNFVHTAGTFNHNNGTVELNGAVQALSGAATSFYNINLSNASGTVSDNVTTTINHALTAAAGNTLNMGTSQLLGSFDATGLAGTLNTGYTATTAPVPAGLMWGGTVNFNSVVAAQTVSAGSYNNLKTTGTTFAKNFGGAMNVAGDLTMTTTTGVISLGGNTNVTGNIAISGSTANNIFDDSLNYPITLGGNWSVFSTSAVNLFNGRAGTVTLNGTGVQNISVAGGPVLPNFFNLTYNNTSNPLALNTNTNVTGTLTVSANTEIIPGAAVVFNNSAATGSITGAGTIQVTRTAVTAGYTGQYKFTTSTLSNMTVNYSASAPQFVSSFTYGALRTTGSGTKTALGNLTVNNLLDVAAGTTLDMGAANTLLSGTAPVYSVTGTLSTSVPTSTSATPIPTGINWGGAVQYGATSGAQTIVSGTYNNLSLSNTSGVNASAGDVTVNGSLALGKITIGSNNLILGNSASITGASSSNYVVTGGTGKLRKMLTANGSFTFPLGDIANYTPITLAMTGSGYSGAYMDVKVAPSKSVHNVNTNNYINRTWTINTSGITSPSWTVTSANYAAGDIVGMESAMVAASYQGSLPWIKYGIPSSNTLSTTAIGVITAEVSAISASLPTVNVTPSSAAFCSGNSSVLTATGAGDLPLSYSWSPASSLSATTGSIVTANPTTGSTPSSYTYTVTITDGNGNSSTASVTLTVNPQPTAITGTLTVCEGLTTALSSTPASGAWSSNSTSVATIGSASGIVTGILAGTSIISYVTIGGCSSSSVVTVNQSPATIGGNPAVCAGLTTTLTNTIGGGTWTSSAMSVATVGSTSGVVTGVAAGNATITYTLPDGCYSILTITVNPLPATITGTATVCEGSTTTLADATASGTWASGTTSAATIGVSSGIVTGVLMGNTTITYTLPTGCIATRMVTVNQTPAAIMGTPTVCAGLTTSLTNAIGGGTWSSSATAIATVGTSGIATGVMAGNATITYTLPDACYSTLGITVNPLPAAITGTATVCEGLTTTLADATASGTWSSGSTSNATIGVSTGIVTGVLMGNAMITYTIPTGCIATTMVTVNQSPAAIGGTAVVCAGLTTTLTNAIGGGTWGSNDNMIATVDMSGVVTGVAAGNTTITYTLPDGCFAVKSLTVNPLPASITGTASVCEGSATTLTDASAGGTWASNNTSIATIGVSSGSLNGVAAGNTTVTYTLPTGCLITAPVTVNPTPVAITGTPGMCVGYTTTLNDATNGGTWASSNTSVATVNASGVVSGLMAGTTRITYTLPAGCFATKLATVFATPTGITGSLVVCEGATSTLGNSVTGGTWSSSNYAVASISLVSGIVTGIATGTATITYTLATGCTATSTATINPAPHAGAVSGPTSVGIGVTIALTDPISGGVWSAGNANATVGSASGIVTGANAGTVVISYSYTNSCGTDVAPLVVTVSASVGITGTGYVCVGTTSTLSNATGGGVWTSSSNVIATVGSSTGVVTGVGVGTCMITYNVSSMTYTKVVTVTSTVANITGTTAACLNASAALSCSVPGGTWLTNNSAIATVDPATGLVTGVGVGTTTITYSFGTGCYKTATFTVRPLPAAIVGGPTVCIGSTATLTDATSGIQWTSSTPSVATIGSTSGVVSGVALGTTTISYILATGCYTTSVISVNPLPSSIIGAFTTCAGSSTVLGDADGGGTWTSSTTAIATVGGTSGTVSGVAAGTTTITYTLGTGCRRTQSFTVNPLPGAISGTTTVCQGSTSQLSSSTSGGTWTSSTPSVATIGSSSGLVSGLTIGSSVVTYTIGTGCSIASVVNVGIALSPITGTATVCSGRTSTLTNSTTGGTWSTDGSGYATISGSGVVTGVVGGTAAITYATSPGCRSTVVETINQSPAAISGTNNVCVNSSVTLSDATTGGTWSSSNTALGTVVAATGVVTGVSAGVPAISYIVPNGCYQTYNVTVKALPAAIVGTTAICVGGTQTLTDPTSGGVSWMSSTASVATIGSISGVVNGVSAGTTTITFNLLTGCYTTTVVTISATPSAGTISGGSSVIIGNSVTLSSTIPGGTWTSGATGVATVGSSSGVVTGVSAGGTAISYTVNNGCGNATASQAMTVTASKFGGNGSTVKLADGTTLMLYPNPTQGAFTIEAPEAGVLTMSTLEGQSVGKINVAAGVNSLSMPREVAAGIYMCRYTGNSGAVVVIRLVYEP